MENLIKTTEKWIGTSENSMDSANKNLLDPKFNKLYTDFKFFM
jgi:hypothetical protein